MSKEILKSACGTAHLQYPKNCSGAVRLIAKEMGFNLPPELGANGLIDYFENASNGWLVVNETDAQTAADNGRLVIAGKKDNPNGHVVVVMPGGKISSGGYDYTDSKTKKLVKARSHGQFPRACSTSLGSWPGGVSKGEKTVFDSWGNDTNYRGVKYWVSPLVSLSFHTVKPGENLVAKVSLLKGRMWAFPSVCKLTSDIPAGTKFKVGGIHLAEKWVDVQAPNLVGLNLRVSAEELVSIFKLG
jgi:hypothetical protein